MDSSFQSFRFDSRLTRHVQLRARCGSSLRRFTDAGPDARRKPEVVLANDPEITTLVLVTTCVGLSMFLAGITKRRLRWRTEPREHRRRRHWRRHR